MKERQHFKTLRALETGMKICTGCNIDKPLNLYALNPQSKIGTKSKCKKCTSLDNSQAFLKKRKDRGEAVLNCDNCDLLYSKRTHDFGLCRTCLKEKYD